MTKKPTIICFDLEMAPALVYAWDLKVQGGYIRPDMIVHPKRILCAAVQVVGTKDMHFYAEWDDGGNEAMIRKLWEILDSADATLTYNGLGADLPWLATEFVKLGLPMPSPCKDVDLYRIIRRRFRFLSNSLKYVCSALETGQQKLETGGMQLWRDVMAGDPVAQKTMQTYCEGDVQATCDLFEKIKTYAYGLPNAGLYEGNPANGCVWCGGRVTKSGMCYTASATYQRWKCAACHRYSRSARRTATTELRAAA